MGSVAPIANQGAEMNHPTRQHRHCGPALLAAALICAAAGPTACSRRVPFASEHDAATAKMLAAANVEASGDADADFVAAMIPHHQVAIDMAKAELRDGQNEQLRRLAQEIIVTQQQEIMVMRIAIGEPPSKSMRTHEEK